MLPDTSRQGQTQGQGQRNDAEFLKHYLNALENVIRKELAELQAQSEKVFRSESKRLRLSDLTLGLTHLEAARAELARCPAGAALAVHVLEVAFSKTRTHAQLGKGHQQSSQRGGDANKAKQRRAAVRLRNKLRRDAAKLNQELSTSAKARILAKTSRLSESRIRHIIAK